MHKPDRIDLTLAARIQEVERLAGNVDAFCERHGLPPKVAFQFNLCFDEVVTNLITHGGLHAPSATIRISLFLAGGWIRAEVADEGPPFNPLSGPEPDLTLDVEDRPIGGLGIYFVRTVMDEVRYDRRDGYNIFAFGQSLARKA